MKLLVAIASTLLLVLISQQFTSAFPTDGSDESSTSLGVIKRDEAGFFTQTTEEPLTGIKRENEETFFEETTSAKVEEQEKRQPMDQLVGKQKREVDGNGMPIEDGSGEGSKREEADESSDFATTEKTKRAKTVKVIEKEEAKEIEESTKETPKKVKVTVEETKLEKVDEESKKEIPKKVKVSVEEEHKEIEESTKETPKVVKVSIEPEKVEKVEEERKKIPKKEKILVEEEEPKKVEEEKVEESDFCPEGYSKFEEGCLFVGNKPKVSARSGKVSSSSSTTNMVEDIPIGDDNSCPPGTEHTERGVCQKILTQEELKLKKVESGCPDNSRLVEGKCIFHSFDVPASTMEMPLETSERMEVQPEFHREEDYSTAAPEYEFNAEWQFETTMQPVVKL